MTDNVLINKKFDNAITKYIELSKIGGLETCNDFFVKVIKCLVFIYGDLDLINPHITKDTKALFANFGKYGYAKNDIINFIDSFTSQSDCNKVSIATQLIDMFFLKTKILTVTEIEKTTFLHILYNLTESQEVYYYFDNKFNEKSEEKEIEFLEVEPNLKEKEINKKLTFQYSAASGYVSIITILITIALVCVGITIVNILVG